MGEISRQKSGLIFFVFNTHLNCISESEIEKSCELLIEKRKEIAKDAPFILCGDFNTEMNNTGLKKLLQSGLNEAYLSSKLPPHGATNSNPNECNRTRIDHIFLSKEFETLKYDTLTDHITSNEKKGACYTKVMRYPSDHYPILAKIQLALK